MNMDKKFIKIINSTKNNIYENNQKILLIFIFIIISLQITLSKKLEQRKLILYSEISIIITGTGTQQILSSCYYYSFYQIVVNENTIDTNERTVNDLTEETNNIKIRWSSDNLDTCECMFQEMINIINVDFTYFDVSQVTKMTNMFHGCTNLKSINFGNINTSTSYGSNVL